MTWLIIISILISISNVHTLVSIGANFGGLRDYSRGQPYINLIKQSRVWGTANTPWDGNATLDPISGWPTQDFGVILASGSVDMGGKYLLYAKGNAEISVDLQSNAYVSNKTYDSSTNTLTAFINIPENATYLMLSFRNTTGPGLQDIALLQPGYDMTSQSDITKVTLAHLSRFKTLRFMDWTDTNGNPEVNWNETTPVNWPQYTPPKRNPWATIPFIANQINQPTDIWINIPISASDDYILNVARIMLSDLNPTNNIYVEYSNEIWNYGFEQAHTNLDIANDSVLHHGDPYHFNYDNCSNAWYWATRRTAYQIKHISDLFKTVFGDENVGPWKRVRPILAGQAVAPFVIKLGVDYLDAVFGPPSNFLHGIAIAPYFDLGEVRTWSNLTTDQVLDGFNSTIQSFLPEQDWSQKAPLGAHGVYASWYKLAVYGYEGGPDTSSGCGACSLEAKINATRDPRMTDLCVTFLNRWYGYGFQELNWYEAGAGEIGKYGSWSLVEDMREETLIDTTTMFNSTSPVAQLPRPSPKLKAMDQVHQSSIQFNFGFPIPSLNVNATRFMGHQVPYPYPDVRIIAANDTFYYPLQIRQSPIRINVTVYVGGDSGLLEGGINNEQYVEVQTPKTANKTTFEAAPVMQFSVSQTRLPSIVTLRLRNIRSSYAYAIRSFDVIPSTS
jgi:hypothetical protein